MADENKKKGVSTLAAFVIGLVLGGGLMLVYHALDAKVVNFELLRARREGDEFRILLTSALKEREAFRAKLRALEQKP